MSSTSSPPLGAGAGRVIVLAAAEGRDPPEVLVVVLSAYETEESAEAVLAAGAFAFLPKHCGADCIRDVVLSAWRS